MAAHTLTTDPTVMAHIADMHTLANQMRALKAKIDDFKTLWNASLGANFGTNADTWDEGREAEGVTPLTSLQINQLTTEMFKTSTGGSSEWNSQIVQAMCIGLLAAQ